MKKTLGLILVALALVASMGLASVVNASVASAVEDTAQGAGTLTAQGDGIAILGGRGSVDVSGNGLLWIHDRAGDAIIEVTGYGEREVFADGWIQYSGFHGRAHVKGSRIIVVLAGADVELSAHGRGRVILWGHGTYEINGHAGRWSTGLPTRIRLASPNVSLSE
ncbi:MAG: hypothetical protein ACE5IE_03760 [Dehalococcoidia bacterium]